MYIPAAFRETDLPFIHETMRAAGLANLVTTVAGELVCSPLPLFLAADEGGMGTLYGHLAKANPQWRETPAAEALAIFMGPDAYVTPSWYEGKSRDGKVVPTWNYVAVHAYGPVEFFEDAERLLEVVTRLTSLHEASRPQPWAVGDAPPDFVRAQLRGIVGVRMPITRIDAKRKMSQNRSGTDRATVKRELSASGCERERQAATLIPE
ncbi:transcriptional regulator [Azospirillum lipoferum]|uniref:FMN-binding negative transcriptional regulator n=1 Tax=Azospirillum lipoferum TaxID=193 RepID=A0A5A9GQH4_AZOLI|nr:MULTISPECIES: FMN-binding negative transcriptional regulator [Azospirillum]KAA0596731.1 FMN-binding negative transcriptional regulator [Azospirillum lipoferum]MCP1610753.1 transcriptional regulator [Azospirillum lipoferum]MDW5537802.1 FMN-binding negative transcriptional regulator [Azospirillum sp. NL1]